MKVSGLVSGDILVNLAVIPAEAEGSQYCSSIRLNLKLILDTNGNFVILDITIQDYRLTLVVIYGPNDDNPDFFQSLQR